MKPLLTAIREGRLYLDGGMGKHAPGRRPAGGPPARRVGGGGEPPGCPGHPPGLSGGGRRLITTNTFGTTAPKVEPYGYTVAQVMSAAVANVRAAMDQAGGDRCLRLRRHRPHRQSSCGPLRGLGL